MKEKEEGDEGKMKEKRKCGEWEDSSLFCLLCFPVQGMELGRGAKALAVIILPEVSSSSLPCCLT